MEEREERETLSEKPHWSPCRAEKALYWGLNAHLKGSDLLLYQVRRGMWTTVNKSLWFLFFFFCLCQWESYDSQHCSDFPLLSVHPLCEIRPPGRHEYSKSKVFSYLCSDLLNWTFFICKIEAVAKTCPADGKTHSAFLLKAMTLEAEISRGTGKKDCLCHTDTFTLCSTSAA